MKVVLTYNLLWQCRDDAEMQSTETHWENSSFILPIALTILDFSIFL
jgi:hypothetical protein